MILRKIEALRLQPKYIRVRYAFTLSFFITFFIAAIWLYTVFDKFEPEEATEVVEVDSSLSRFLGDMKESLIARIQLLKPTTEYVRQPAVESKTPQLDLDAIVASSTQQKLKEQLRATSTEGGRLTATSSPTSTTETMR
jgi:type II secretory pathway component PulC